MRKLFSFTALFLLLVPLMARAKDVNSFILHDKLRRTYHLHIPTGYDEAKPLPLVITLDHSGGAGKNIEKISGFSGLADKENFFVVYPDAIEGSWNDGLGIETLRAVREHVDDVGFISVLIDQLAADYKIDLKRVYVTGISSGGNLSQRIACDLSDKIAAFAAVGSVLPEKQIPLCKPAQPIAALFIIGTHDPVYSWDGGNVTVDGKDYPYSAVNTTLNFWLAHNGCKGQRQAGLEPDADPKDGTRVWRETYTDCANQAAVGLYAIINGGHNWPGVASDLPPEFADKISYDINATQVIWQFFAVHFRS